VSQAEFELTEWRREVASLYAAVRGCVDPAEGHAMWRAGRDELFRDHPQTPLLPDDPLRDSGLPYWPYDPTLRFGCALEPSEPEERQVPTSSDGTIDMHRIGLVRLPDPVGGTLDVWWLDQYGGGLFLPMRDATAGRTSYGAGRYLLDIAKGADLGGTRTEIVIDLNFAYHPSCRYNPRWECPLPADGNRIDAVVEAGERLPVG
jgi:uncharacterized protein (DUF1684 family)